ncbi:MAG TPA: glycosyltransferase, partial [Thermoanaerobaculia bacterium]|nr:glycosyltransferase [Thermoanaerobaculia bacterium]
MLAAWALQALVSDHDVTVLGGRPPSAAELNRFAGTSLREGAFRIERLPLLFRAIERLSPTPLALLHRAVAMRTARKLAPGFDLVLSLDNEVDVGRRAIQYVHFPWGYWPRPDVDLRWYHAGALLRGYYALARRIAGVRPERIAENVTLVNSDWTGEKFRATYGGTYRTVRPPAAGTFPDVPWEEREDRFIVLGRLAPEKELEKIVAIVEGVRALGHPVRLLVVGILAKRGRHRRYARRILAMAGDRDWMEVRLEVPRAELETLLARSRWGLHGMAEEHYGMAVAEMVLAGCVPFVPDGGGAVEIAGECPELRY